MGSTFDVVVIGAGLGGLSAAAYLSRKGKRVLLLERHNVPGGYATSFVRGRYEFETALHELSGVGRSEQANSLMDYLDELGVADQMEFVQVPDIYRSVFPDFDLVLPHGREAYESTLCEQFPHEADNIHRFLNIVFELQEETSELEKAFENNDLGLLKLMSAPVRFPRAFRYLPATWGQVLDREVKDPMARAVLSQYWGFFGLPPSQVSFLYFALALATYVRDGAWYPKGRSQALANAFLKAIERWGGETRMSCGVRRILVRGGRVHGVVTDGEEQIDTKQVICNADPVVTCRDLIGLEEVPRSYLKRLGRSRIGGSSLNVYLGVAASPEEIGAVNHEVFINDDYDIESHHANMRELAPPKMMAMTCYNAVVPEISPPGTSLIVLTTLVYGEPWLSVRPQDYLELKTRIGDGMIERAERVLPGLRELAEVAEVSTPLTNLRYAGNTAGAIYGFDQYPWDSTVFRLGHRGAVEGLYQAGAWTQPGGGFQPAMMSGRMAATQLLSDEGSSGRRR